MRIDALWELGIPILVFLAGLFVLAQNSTHPIGWLTLIGAIWMLKGDK